MLFASDYYLDFILLLRDFFYVILVLTSLCFYTFIETKFKSLNLKISLFYSASLYMIFISYLYLVSLCSTICTEYYLLNFTVSNLYGVDFFKFCIVILFIFIFYGGISDNSFQLKKYIYFESVYILSFIFIGIIFLLYSFDFLMVFLNLELQNFSLYILLNIQRNKKTVIETCIKYYIIGGISSGLILYGISIIYGITGHINFLDLIFFFSELDVLLFSIYTGLIFFFFGLFIKLGLAPFHFWVPQVYAGAPSFITLILLVLPKFVLFLLFLKIYFFVFKTVYIFFFDIFSIIALLSLFSVL